MPATIDDNKHKIFYSVGTNLNTRVAGMLGPAPMYILPGNVLAQVGASWLKAPVGGRIYVSYHEIEFLMLEGFKMTDDALSQFQGYHIGAPHLSQLLAELDFVLMPSSALDREATRDLIKSWANDNLADADRTLTTAKLLQGPTTTTGWQTAVTGRMVTGPAGAEGPDQDLSALRHFRMLIAGGYNSADQVSGRYLDLCALVEDSLSCPAGASDSSVANRACRWALSVKPSGAFDKYVAFDDAASEIVALSPGGARADALIFEHRFQGAWRRAFPNISKALPNPVGGAEAYKLSGTLAVRYKMGTPFSEEIACALDMALERALLELDTADLKTKTNFDRVAVLGNAVLDSSGSKGAGGPGGTNSAGGDNLHTMYANADFDDLTKQMEALAVPGYDPHAGLKLLLEHTHPMGLVFSLGKRFSHPVWSKLSGLQTESCARELLQLTLSVDKQGVTQMSWSLVLQKDVPLKMRDGRHDIGDGKAQSIHYYKDVIKACLEKREGIHILALYAAYESLPADAIFLDPQLMRYAEKIMTLLFAFVGYTGKSSTSFRAFWQGMIDRAQVLASLPSHYPVVVALKEKLREAGRLTFSASSEQHSAMVTASFGVLKRPAGFFLLGSKGYVAITEYDVLVVEVLKDLERGKYGMARTPGVAGSSHLLNALVGASPQPAAVTLTPKRGRDTWADWTGDETFDPTVTGVNAARHGVWVSPEGACFGWTFLTLAEGATCELGACVAALAKSKHGYTRDMWHIAPGCNCVAGHPRPAGVRDDQIIEKPITKEQRDAMTCLVEPSQPDEKRLKGGGQGTPSTALTVPDGGKGGGGKGKGGKGGKGSKGKGSKGKGKGAHFRRQN